MPEINQYTFDHIEVITALLRDAGIHEGLWSLLISFGFNGGNVGFEEGKADPTAMVAIKHIGLIRATGDMPDNLIADAAVVNPKSE